MKCLVKPKGGLYIFGVIFLYLFFAFGPVFETVALIVDGPDNTLEISDFVIMAIFCYLFPVLFIVLHTIEITKYRAEITESDITISSTHFFLDVLFQKKKTIKYKFENLKAMQLQKGVFYPNGYTVRFELIYDRKSKYLDLSRFSKKQVEDIKLKIIEIAKKQNGFEPTILEIKDRMWLSK